MDFCQLKNSELELQFQKHKDRVVLRGDMVKDDSGSQWSLEKPKLDNARKLRGIYFIDLRTRNSKKTLGMLERKLETPMAPAMPCKTSKNSQHGVTRGKSNEFKSKLACILEASESTRLRVEESLPNYHEDHIAGRRQFTATLQFGTQIYSYASSHEDSCSKGSSG